MTQPTQEQWKGGQDRKEPRGHRSYDSRAVSEADAAEITTSPEIGSRAVGNTMLVLGARVASRLASLVIVIALANGLGASGYGRYVTLIAYSGLISVVADLGLSTLYTREAAREPAHLAAYLGNLLSGKLVLAAAALLVMTAALSAKGLGDLILPGAALLVMTSFVTVIAACL